MLRKTILFFTIACLFFDISFAQTIQRNLLARFSLNVISAALISKEQWKPFPTAPEGWKAALPDTLLKL